MEKKKAKKGIGWGGKTLKEMLAEKEQLYRETGYYYGLKELPLMKEDPLKMEVFFSRLLATVVAGRETTRMITASPFVREVGELAVALYTPEGDCILQSTGIIIHIPLMGQVISWMIKENYEEDPGINEGDIFTSNDNQIAGMHPLDIYDIIPIFYEGELVGWVGTVIMEPDVGAISCGMMPMGATERFVEGLRWSAEKTGTNDRYSRFFEARIRHGCRLPDVLLLDRKGALAADVKVREEVKRIIGEFGIDYYKGAIKELIEAERRAQLERVKTRMVPGRLRAVSCCENYYSKAIVPPHHRVDRITLVPIDAMIQPDGKFFWDFDGTGSWGWHANNCSPSALTGGACLLLSQQIAYTGKANQGTMLCVEMNTPYDTYVYPSSPDVGTMNQFSVPTNGGALIWNLNCRTFFSRGFVEEVMACALGLAGPILTGTSHHGGPAFPPGEVGSTPSGGCAIRDGFTGWALFVPNTDMGSVEVWELATPLNYTGRRLLPDSCGWGKYRSGYGVIFSYMVYKSPQLAFEKLNLCRDEKIHPNVGMFGGYPGSRTFAKLLTNANTAQLIEQRKPLVHGMGCPGEADIEDLEGNLEVTTLGAGWLEGIAKHGDLYQAATPGVSPGFGDPIKRDPALVKEDLDSGLLSIERCRSIYGVEASYDEKAEEWAIDEKKTAELRKKKRKERLAKGITAKQWWQKRRQDLIEGNLTQLLKEMYNDSLAKGKKWPGEFIAFWGLPSDFKFE
jgi:acetone carboxylase alpha subunit